MIEGISHITFIVKDLQKSSNLFKNIFNAEEIYDSSENHFSYSREKFFIVSNQWIVLMEGESLNEQSYNHLAFKIADEDYDELKKKLRNMDLKSKRGVKE